MTVRTHSWLRRRGGAAAVARALHVALDRAGRAHGYGYELDDVPHKSGDGVRGSVLQGEVRCPPGEAGRAGASLVHAHGSGDWPALLDGLAASGTRALVTLHDCRLLTGGCPYPLDCRAWETGCPDPCPRGFPEAHVLWRDQRQAMGRVAPVLVSPSSWMAGLARVAFPGADVRVLPNGVPWPSSRSDGLPTRAEARARCGIPPDAPLALFAAHGGEEAGYKAGDRWAGLWAAIRSRAPGAVCFMAGGRDLSRDDALGLYRWPWLEPDALGLFMRAADVFVYPSLADNHPLLVLEAMSRGSAVAAFAVGGVPEQVDPGRTGVLVRPGDWDGLAAQAAVLLRDRIRAHSLGRAARAAGAGRFSRERMVGDYLRLFQTLES